MAGFGIEGSNSVVACSVIAEERFKCNVVYPLRAVSHSVLDGPLQAMTKIVPELLQGAFRVCNAPRYPADGQPDSVAMHITASKTSPTPTPIIVEEDAKFKREVTPRIELGTFSV